MYKIVLALFVATTGILCSGNMSFADQAAISIDGDFSDWSQIPAAYSDASNDSSNGEVNFGDVWIADDSRFLFIRIDFGMEFDSNENNDVRIYIDTDSNQNTGTQINGIGAELEWQLGTRFGFFHINGSTPLSGSDIRFRGGPTVTSNQFELAIGRDTLPDGVNDLFPNSHVKIAIVDHSGPDQVPDSGDIIEYQFDAGSTPPVMEIPLSREAASDLRLITHNVLFDSPWNAGVEPMFGRQWAAVAPDILNLQEIYNHTPQETAQLIANWIPLGAGQTWHAAGNNDCITVSKFPVLDSWALNGNLAVLLDTTSQLSKQLLVINAHLPCCDNEIPRQTEIDRIMAFIRDAKSPGGDVSLAPDTPIVITGDMNLVGLSQQLTSLITGDIVFSQFGADFAPDWDDTDLTNVVSRQTEKRMGYTWRNDFSSFWPGQLDFVIYSDSVLELRNNYILYTPEMTNPQQYSMQPNDSTASDHLLFCTDFRCPPGVLLGDINMDGFVNLLDVGPFVDLLSSGQFKAEADINEDGDVNLLDVEGFISLLSGS